MEINNHKTHEEIWDPENVEIPTSVMIQRVHTTVYSIVWRHIIKLLKEKNIPIRGLNVVEVGCGTGTGSLTLGLLGANITLIDINQKVLDRTKKMFEEFRCPARFIRSDCVGAVPEELKESFDLALSGGLAEHFIGKYREQCIRYHYSLLRHGGIAMIAVPNRWSPFYQWIRIFRTWTKTWDLDVEEPFTHPELMALAKKITFSEFYVLGSASLIKDFWVYSRGFISAVVDICPSGLGDRVRRWKRSVADKSSLSEDPRKEAEEDCRDAMEAALSDKSALDHSMSADWLSAGLVVLGIR